MTVAGIDLSDTRSGVCRWPTGPPPSRSCGREGRPQFYAEPEIPFAEVGPGYYALVRHADIVEASRHPDVVLLG